MQHFLFSWEGIPLVELMVKHQDCDLLPPTIQRYYDEDVQLLKTWCETTLLPQRAAVYQQDKDPRKRFHIKKLCLFLSFSATHLGPLVTVVRTLNILHGSQSAKDITEEVFVLPKGIPIPKKYIFLYQKEDQNERRTPTPHAKRLPIFRKSRPPK